MRRFDPRRYTFQGADRTYNSVEEIPADFDAMAGTNCIENMPA